MLTIHDINFVMLKKNDFFIKQLRYFFDRGLFPFQRFRMQTNNSAAIELLNFFMLK